jgi:hypothetical protein
MLNGSIIARFGFDGIEANNRGELISIYVDANLFASASGLAELYNSTRKAYFAFASVTWSDDERIAAWNSWYLESIEAGGGYIFVERPDAHTT